MTLKGILWELDVEEKNKRACEEMIFGMIILWISIASFGLGKSGFQVCQLAIVKNGYADCLELYKLINQSINQSGTVTSEERLTCLRLVWHSQTILRAR